MCSSRRNGFLDGLVKEAGISSSLLKSIDRLNNFAIKQGKKVADSKMGQKAIDSGVGKKISGAVDNMADKSAFVNNLVGKDTKKLRGENLHLMKQINDMKNSNPNVVALNNARGVASAEYGAARAKALASDRTSKRLAEKENKLHNSMGGLSGKKWDKTVSKINKVDGKLSDRLDKLSPDAMAFKKSVDEAYKNSPDIERLHKLEGARNNAFNAYKKATRDTRNARRKFTGGVIGTGIGVGVGVPALKSNADRQRTLEDARMSYYY